MVLEAKLLKQIMGAAEKGGGTGLIIQGSLL